MLEIISLIALSMLRTPLLFDQSSGADQDYTDGSARRMVRPFNRQGGRFQVNAASHTRSNRCIENDANAQIRRGVRIENDAAPRMHGASCIENDASKQMQRGIRIENDARSQMHRTPCIENDAEEQETRHGRGDTAINDANKNTRYQRARVLMQACDLSPSYRVMQRTLEISQSMHNAICKPWWMRGFFASRVGAMRCRAEPGLSDARTAIATRLWG